MNCHELARRIEELQPSADPRDVARLCLLLANMSGDFERFAEDDQLTRAWREVTIRMQAAIDQHAAMTSELEMLSQGDLTLIGQEQIWTLLRALKVQSQLLQFYIGPPLNADLV
jgi:hypothetical protein